MAKYRHRIFEMYEQRDEAMHALTPRSEKTATEATAPESWGFTHLTVSRNADLIAVRFQSPPRFEEGDTSDLRDDLTRLADLLGRDSRILVDFTGVASFNAASVAALIQFHRTLQTRGSRMALCCLEPAARESFFVTG